MIEERALVLSALLSESPSSPKLVRVKVQRTSSCESCSLKSGCGQSTLTKMSGDHCLELDVANSLDAKEGDEVMIAIPESGLMSASLRVYFIPLVLMLLGAVIGGVIDDSNETWAGILSILGLVLGFAWARVFSQKQALNENYQPKMTQILIAHTVAQTKPINH